MSIQEEPNPYFFSPKYTQQLFHKGKKEKGSTTTDYRDWREWNLARDGTEGRLRRDKSSQKRVGGAAVQDGGVKKSKKRASTMLEVQGRLLAKAAEYTGAPVVPAESEPVVGWQKQMPEVAEEGVEGDEELEVTAQLQRESELEPRFDDEIRPFGHAPKIVSKAGVVGKGILRGRPSRKRRRRVTINIVPKVSEIEDIENTEEITDVGPTPPPLDYYALESSPDVELKDIYDMSEDYRGRFERPTNPVEKIFFPMLPRQKTEITKQSEVVESWQALLEKRKALEPYDVDLVKHTEGRLQAHLAELERLIAVEPYLPRYSTTRIAALKDCLTRYVNADEILNVKAVIKAFEDKVLGNHMDQWTIFYNGKIVDRINSYRELLWSVRNPLYKEVYGSKGSIWIEPPTNDVSKACVTIESPQFVSGAHWYVKQNICLPWYEANYSLELDFLLDSGATDPLVDDKDLLDLGLIKLDCPHVTNRSVSTASGRISVDFYPLLIQHLDRDEEKNKVPLYPFMDTIIGTTVGHAERLSGLDIYRFCYVTSEPSTGRCSYHPRYNKLEIRDNIAPGGAMTPRAWFTRTWDQSTQRYAISSTMCSLTGRPPRLLNPDGDRWVENVNAYPYQYGQEDRSPYRIGYIPGHKVHPPTPDYIRDDRKYYWSRGLAYRDNRPFVGPRFYSSDRRHYPRDQYYDYQLREEGRFEPRPTTRPLNPWQFKAPKQHYRQPTGQLMNLPINPPGVMYWDRKFPNVARRLKLDPGIVPSDSGYRYRNRKEDDFWEMRNANLAGHSQECPVTDTKNGTNLRQVNSKGKVKRPKYFSDEVEEEEADPGRRESDQA